MTLNLNKLSLKWKLALIIATTSTFVLGGSGIIFYYYEALSIKALLARDFLASAEMAASNVTAAMAFNDRKDAEETLSAFQARPNVRFVAIYDNEGKKFASYQRSGESLPPDKLSSLTQVAFTADAIHVVQPIVQSQNRLGHLHVCADLSILSERLRVYVIVVAGVVMIGALASLAIAFMMQRIVSKPVLNLAAVAQAVSEHRDYSARAQKQADDELGTLIDQFNDMLSQIQQRDAALHEAQVGLEKKVEERTAEIKQLNESLQQRAAQLEIANRELESFSYSVSHDLRAPLRHISGFVDMLEYDTKGKLDERTLSHVKTIQESVREAGALIDDLLAFSRMGRADMQVLPVDLNEVARDVSSKVASEVQGRKIAWDIKPLPIVHADAAMMRLVFTNLFSNAIKYTRPRAEATIEVGSSTTDTEDIVFVRDNGIGFDMRYVERLFGVFHRLHGQEFEGTGIGLANVRRIITRHGGRTWAEGAVQKGATFYFSLPRHKGAN